MRDGATGEGDSRHPHGTSSSQQQAQTARALLNILNQDPALQAQYQAHSQRPHHQPAQDPVPAVSSSLSFPLPPTLAPLVVPLMPCASWTFAQAHVPLLVPSMKNPLCALSLASLCVHQKLPTQAPALLGYGCMHGSLHTLVINCIQPQDDPDRCAPKMKGVQQVTFETKDPCQAAIEACD